MHALDAIVFDFDFTLADSSVGVVKCVRFALDQLGFRIPEENQIHRTIGLSLPETFYTLTGSADKASAKHFSAIFLEHANVVMEANTIMYPTVGVVMDLFNALGVQTAIVSTKYRSRIMNILTMHGHTTRFSTIVGAEDVPKHKPDPSGIILALEQLRATPERTVYVGDHVVDAIAANAAGVSFIATLSGLCQAEEFRPYPYKAIVGGIEDLPRVLGVQGDGATKWGGTAAPT